MYKWSTIRELIKNDNNSPCSVEFISSREMAMLLNRCVQLGVKVATWKLTGLVWWKWSIRSEVMSYIYQTLIFWRERRIKSLSNLDLQNWNLLCRTKRIWCQLFCRIPLNGVPLRSDRQWGCLVSLLCFTLYSSDSCWRKQRERKTGKHEGLLWRRALLKARIQ